MAKKQQQPQLRVSIAASQKDDGDWTISVIATKAGHPQSGVPIVFMIRGDVKRKATDQDGTYVHVVKPGKVTVQVADLEREYDLAKAQRKFIKPPSAPMAAPPDIKNIWQAMTRGWQDGRKTWKEAKGK